MSTQWILAACCFLHCLDEKKKAKQKSVVLMLEKATYMPSGLILSKKPYMSEKAEIKGVSQLGLNQSTLYNLLIDITTIFREDD